jgi:hypothetical protein
MLSRHIWYTAGCFKLNVARVIQNCTWFDRYPHYCTHLLLYNLLFPSLSFDSWEVVVCNLQNILMWWYILPVFIGKPITYTKLQTHLDVKLYSLYLRMWSYNTTWEVIGFVKDLNYNATEISYSFLILAIVTKTHCTKQINWILGFKFTDTFHN